MPKTLPAADPFPFAPYLFLFPLLLPMYATVFALSL